MSVFIPKNKIIKYTNILSNETLELFKDYNFISPYKYGNIDVNVYEYEDYKKI